MKFGEELILRASKERVFLITRLDLAGNILVGRPGQPAIEVHEDDVERVTEDDGCGCCADPHARVSAPEP